MFLPPVCKWREIICTGCNGMSPPANSWITFLLLIKDGILMALEVDRFV
jgi:hypothetical protein